ncbi:MAG: Hsp20/alpha crystallin family protein [Hyphomicrobiaceae bacterium]
MNRRTSITPYRQQSLSPYGGGGPDMLVRMVQDMDDMMRRLQRVFGDDMQVSLAQEGPWQGIDLSDTDDAYKLEVELPGMKADNVDVCVTADRQLRITGEWRSRGQGEQQGKEQSESGAEGGRGSRRQGRFARTMTLPPDVDEDGISARFEDGVLEVVLPKSQESERVRRIEVARSSEERKEGARVQHQSSSGSGERRAEPARQESQAPDEQQRHH